MQSSIFYVLKSKYPHIIAVIKYMALFALSILFLLIFSLWTSPMYKNWYGCDASFFTMAGRGIVNGFVPYKDFFDLKGPYFFFLEALGQLIYTGRTGAFIIQVFALFFTLILMIRTCRLFISSKKTSFIVAIFLIFHAATLWGGNTLEEFMLPLSLLSIYLTLRDLQKTDNIRSSSALVIGICFAVIMFSKITASAPIVGLVIALVVYFIKSKRYLDLISFLLYSFLGVLLGITPVFIYFYMHGMLSEMLYAVFIFAFKRSIDFGTKFSLSWELKISGCYFAMLFVLCNFRNVKSSDCKNKSLRLFLLTLTFTSALITAIVLHLGDPFIYYFTTVYPILMVTFIGVFIIYDPFILFRKWRLDIPLIAFLVTLCYFSSHTANQLNTVIYDRDNTYNQDYVDKANEMAMLIPENERNSVYSINMDMQWFECNQILPCYSYTINLQFFVSLDGRIEDNILNKLNNDPPKWIVAGKDLDSYLPNLNETVILNYSKVYQNEYGILYLRN